mmetsp:Transcript_42170/g.105291  ORF Transcript_42170/g.105291 Transcript_42170/m.105291 type:complete len:230 (+) Transcript_42170:1798-2487(+)
MALEGLGVLGVVHQESGALLVGGVGPEVHGHHILLRDVPLQLSKHRLLVLVPGLLGMHHSVDQPLAVGMGKENRRDLDLGAPAIVRHDDVLDVLTCESRVLRVDHNDSTGVLVLRHFHFGHEGTLAAVDEKDAQPLGSISPYFHGCSQAVVVLTVARGRVVVQQLAQHHLAVEGSAERGCRPWNDAILHASRSDLLNQVLRRQHAHLRRDARDVQGCHEQCRVHVPHGE